MAEDGRQTMSGNDKEWGEWRMGVKVTITVPIWLDRVCAWPAVEYRKWKYGYTFRRIYIGEGLWAILDCEDYYRYGSLKWSVAGKDGKYYPIRGVRVGPREIRLKSLHRVIMKAKKGKLIDHRNGNSLDARRANLRRATNSQNSYNRQKTKTKNATSKYRGVIRFRRTGRWLARIKYRGKSKHLGYYENESDAARAYDKAAKKYYKDFARLNFPEEKATTKAPRHQGIFK
jgi:hypothetical protein